jgi:hypothetical protein
MTIDTHHHMLPDFFWQETENADAPVGGLAPLPWSREATLSFMDDAGIEYPFDEPRPCRPIRQTEDPVFPDIVGLGGMFDTRRR